MEGRRRKGRPRVPKKITSRRRGKGMEELKRIAKKRDEWRKWIDKDQTP